MHSKSADCFNSQAIFESHLFNMMNKLSNWYKISGPPQIGFSYLKIIHQSLRIKYTLSDKVTLSYGVGLRT